MLDNSQGRWNNMETGGICTHLGTFGRHINPGVFKIVEKLKS